MRFGRLQCLMLAVALAGALGMTPAQAGPLAVVANFTDPGFGAQPPWPPGSVTVLDTATDRPVGAPIKVGPNPQAVAITPDGKTAVVACSQSSELYFIDLTAKPPKLIGKPLSVGSGSGDTFYPAGLAMSPDGQFVAVTSTVGGNQRSTQIRYILLVNIQEQSVVQKLDLRGDERGLMAEAAAFTPRGSIVVVGPSAQPPKIFALPYDTGEIRLPEGPDEDKGVFQGPTGFNVTLSPDGSFALVPLYLSKMNLFTLDDAGRLVKGEELIDSGGDGTHSIAISPDGKTAYVRNLMPPNNNIAVFEIGAGPTVKDTGLRLNSEGIPPLIAALEELLGGTAGGWVGSQMIAVTPDGKKIYAPNPFDTGASEFDVGVGSVQVFEAGKTEPINKLITGNNPIAIAIQPQ